MSHVENEPDPSALAESLRAFGYAFGDAVCDVIDNSLAAGAARVDVRLTWEGQDTSVTVTDDGSGMDAERLRIAMRLGSRSPVEDRAKGDLGRFGLGLKTASFSQARRLTVSSRPLGGVVSHAIWDLDHIAETNRWEMGLTPSSTERAKAESLLTDTGTVVAWRKLDRFLGELSDDHESSRDAALRRLDELERVLGLVYGDWLQGRGQVSISVNGNEVAGWDPFLREHEATQHLPTDRLRTREGRQITVSPYILPHHHRLGEAHGAAGGIEGWNAHQGFYVFRNRRLLVAGGWLGLGRGFRTEEHYKLARIRIDLENADDHDWQIDVRKQQAVIPEALRADLARIARRTRQGASDVYRSRGRIIPGTRRSAAKDAVWVARRRSGRTTFEINRRHPLVVELRDQVEDPGLVTSLLQLVEGTVPSVDIAIAHYEEVDEPRGPFADVPLRDLIEVSRRLLAIAERAHGSREAALRQLEMTEPCISRPEVLGLLKEEITDG